VEQAGYEHPKTGDGNESLMPIMNRLILGLLCGAAGHLAAAEPAPVRLIATIPLPGVSGRIDHLAMDAPTHRLFVAALGNDTVEVLEVQTSRRLQTLKTGREPQGLAFLPRLNRLFVANGGSGDLRVFGGGNFQLLQTTGSLPDADNVRFDAASHLIYAGFGGGALVASIPLSGHPESFQLERDGSRLFVNVPGERSVAVVDREQRKVVGKWRLESARSNYPMALDEAGRRLFIGCRSPARLLVLDTTSGRTVAQVEISGDTDDVFYDAKRDRLYVSCGEGFLDVMQRRAGGQYERTAHVATRAGARTGFYSPEADRIFLAVPKRSGQDAEIRIYEPSAIKP